MKTDRESSNQPRIDVEECARQEPALPPGTQIGAYVIQRLVGRGGMGAVYEARHEALGKRVAIKILDDSSSYPDAVQRFLREGRSASRVRHPNVVDVTDIDTNGEYAFLVMEYLEGSTLNAYLRRRGPLSVANALDIMLPVVSGVTAAHDQGIVHRDLKPANIFLTRNIRTRAIHPKVLDFGIAKAQTPGDDSLTHSEQLLGTVHYLSPEQAKNARDVDARSDQYTLLVMLYELLTGVQPFKGHDSLLAVLTAIVSGAFQKPRQLRGDIDPELEAIILRGMSLDREFRFADLRELARALLPFATDHTRKLLAHEFEMDPSSPTDLDLPGCSEADHGTGSAEKHVEPTRSRGHVTRDERAGARMQARTVLARRNPGIRLRWWPWVWAVPVVAAGLALYLGSSSPRAETEAIANPPSRTMVIDVTVSPNHATIELDGRSVGSGHTRFEQAIDGLEHRLVFRADGFVTESHAFRDRPPPARIALVALAPPSEVDPAADIHSLDADRDEGTTPMHETQSDRTEPQTRAVPRVRTSAARSGPSRSPSVERGVNGAPRVY